jgi:hypothetical protein
VTSDPIARYLSQRTAKMDRRNRLRVMTTNEIIDAAMRVYQALGWTFLKLTVVPSLFCLAAVTFFLRFVWPQYFLTERGSSESTQLMEMASTTGLALFVAAPLFVMGVSYTSVVVTQLVSEYMVGNAPSPEGADAKGRQLLTKLFWLNLREVFLASGGFLVSLGLLALAGHLGNLSDSSNAMVTAVLGLAWLGFVAGGVTFLVVITRHALAPTVMTLEGTGTSLAGKRSWALLKGFGIHLGGANAVWNLYLLLGLLWLLVYGGISGSLSLFGYPQNIEALVAGLPFAPVIVAGLGLVPMFLALWTLMPVWAATTTIIYYDRRIRLEGYDIEALAEDVWRADRSRRFEL